MWRLQTVTNLEEGGEAAEEGADDDDSEEHGDNGRDEVEGELILLSVDKPGSGWLRSAASIRKRPRQDVGLHGLALGTRS